MRRIMMTAAVMAAVALAFPAQAQMGGGGGRHRPSADDSKKVDPKKQAADDKAYKAALERIPDPKEKYDPWGGARPATPDTSKKTK